MTLYGRIATAINKISDEHLNKIEKIAKDRAKEQTSQVNELATELGYLKGAYRYQLDMTNKILQECLTELNK
jgi:hypothetical protein